MGRKIVTLMGMHDLVTQIGSKTSEKKSKEAATSYKPFQASSVIVEGKHLQTQYCIGGECYDQC